MKSSCSVIVHVMQEKTVEISAKHEETVSVGVCSTVVERIPSNYGKITQYANCITVT